MEPDKSAHFVSKSVDPWFCSKYILKCQYSTEKKTTYKRRKKFFWTKLENSLKQRGKLKGQQNKEKQLGCSKLKRLGYKHNWLLKIYGRKLYVKILLTDHFLKSSSRLMQSSFRLVFHHLVISWLFSSLYRLVWMTLPLFQQFLITRFA